MIHKFIEIEPDPDTWANSANVVSNGTNTSNSTNIAQNSTQISPNIPIPDHDGDMGINLGPIHIGPNGIDFGVGTAYLAIVVGIANICLLIALIYIYTKNYRMLKSKFTMGLLIFASLLLLQNVISTGVLLLNLIMGMNHPGFDLDRPQFSLSSINIIQLIALSILLKITLD
jgi:hypothetical protein